VAADPENALPVRCHREKLLGVVAPAESLEALIRPELRQLVCEVVCEELNGHAPPVALVAANGPVSAERVPKASGGSPERGETSGALRRCSACGDENRLASFHPALRVQGSTRQ
jgi:hypothetical protein